jgi:hypothetical protein
LLFIVNVDSALLGLLSEKRTVHLSKHSFTSMPLRVWCVTWGVPGVLSSGALPWRGLCIRHNCDTVHACSLVSENMHAGYMQLLLVVSIVDAFAGGRMSTGC